jgi:hypothetical protein
LKNLKFVFLFGLVIVGLLLLLILRGCGPLNEHPILGRVSLRGDGTTELPINISRNFEQPWRFQFDGASDSLAESKIELFLHNRDNEELKINIGGEGEFGKITIPAAKTVRIFDGSLTQLFAVGKTYQEMTISSSLDRKVNATLTFVHKLDGHPVEVTVSLFFVHFRF